MSKKNVELWAVLQDDGSTEWTTGPGERYRIIITPPILFHWDGREHEGNPDYVLQFGQWGCVHCEAELAAVDIHEVLKLRGWEGMPEVVSNALTLDPKSCGSDHVIVEFDPASDSLETVRIRLEAAFQRTQRADVAELINELDALTEEALRPGRGRLTPET